VRLRRSAFTSTALLAFIVLTEVIFTYMNNMTEMAILAISSVLLLVIFALKDEHLN
jgi:hypothetical protein